MTVEEFNKQGIVSPASGEKWNIKNVISKLKERSLINMEESAKINFYVEGKGDFGDIDIIVEIQIVTASCWMESPTVRLNCGLPIHITKNGDMISGFTFGIDKIPEDPKDRGGNFYIETVADNPQQDVSINFHFSDFTPEELEKIETFVFALIGQRQQMEFLKTLKED